LRVIATIALVLVGLLGRAFGAEFDPFAGPRPLAVWLQSDPWLSVIGSDTPRLVLYDDGSLLLTQVKDQEAETWRAVLAEPERKALLARFRDGIAIADLQKYYAIAQATDQPEARLYLDDGGKSFATAIYGLAPGRNPTGLPKTIQDLYLFLTAFDVATKEKWQPTYVEVMLWDYSYAPDRSVPWPERWPSLTSERAIKRRDDWSIFLDGGEYDAVLALMASRPEKGAIELGGRKWAIACRKTFPGEPAWRAAFAALMK
jgi:hypothetical protein